MSLNEVALRKSQAKNINWAFIYGSVRKRKKSAVEKTLENIDIAQLNLFDDGQKEDPWEEESLILNTMRTEGGDSKGEKSLKYEISKVHGCRRSLLMMEGEKTNEKYVKRVACKKWFCPDCGTVNVDGKIIQGVIQRDRRKAVYRRMNAGIEVYGLKGFREYTKILKSLSQIQYVFTVPMGSRDLFRSKKMVNKLCDSVKKIICKEYPGKGSIAYIHLFGDESTNYHPHINVHVYQDKSLKVMNPEKLEKIKFRYAKALESHGCEIMRREIDGKNKYIVDVHASFVIGQPKRMLHRIRYMTKPVPQEYYYKWWSEKDIEMLEFTIKEMKGFRYIRYWGELGNSKYLNWYAEIKNMDEQEVREMKREALRTEEENLAGERLKSLGIVSMDIDMLMRRKDVIVEKLSNDFYRVRFKTDQMLKEVLKK